ncbi:hypothetical protein RhiJN_07758 [Ceratobasidium sp. AG-Ba]|nr:hypothetical protein RhiJN_07758 [Ceratobasidium sp. AG-Ba]QRW08591.1 hypothetical protein RhiLY_07590 [Ceratobasidium sp. AG-Ba]
MTLVNRRRVQLLVHGSILSPPQATQRRVEDELAQSPSAFRRLTTKQQATVEGFAKKQPPSKAAQPSNHRRQQTIDADAALYNGRPFGLSDIALESTVGKCKPDGLVKSTQSGAPFFSSIIEVKNEIGTGHCDPSIQAGETYGTCWSQPESSRIRESCCCPSLLIAIAGPWMCILGAVYLDRIVVEPLTDYVWLGDHPQKDEYLTRLVRVFRTARASIAELSEYYKALKLPPSSPSSGVFAARTESGDQIVVKFAQQYHIEGHRLLASQRLAPKILFYRGPAYAGGYHLVIMERIGSGSLYGWVKSHVGELEPLRQDVEKALKILHEADLVFGDLRAPNVVVSESDAGRPSGMLVDFDWCGREGEVRYPAAMNEEIDWATGAEAGGLITKQHDMEMLDRLFQ